MTTARRKQVLIISITFFLLIALPLVLIIFFHHTPETPITTINTDWHISFDGVQYENMSMEQLAKQLPRKLQYGDKITTQCTLNISEHYESPTLFLDIHYFALLVYIDNELIASYAMQDFENHQFVGKNYYYISIPENYHGKNLTIDYYYTEKDGVAYLQSPLFGDYSDLQLSFFHKYWFPLACGLFLCVFGIFFFFTSMLFSVLIPEVLGQMISSIISLNLGIWTLSTFRLLPLFVNTLHTTTIDYLTYFMIVPLFFSAHCTSSQNIQQKTVLVDCGHVHVHLIFFDCFAFSQYRPHNRIPFCVLLHRDHFSKSAVRLRHRRHTSLQHERCQHAPNDRANSILRIWNCRAHHIFIARFLG